MRPGKNPRADFTLSRKSGEVSVKEKEALPDLFGAKCFWGLHDRRDV